MIFFPDFSDEIKEWRKNLRKTYLRDKSCIRVGTNSDDWKEGTDIFVEPQLFREEDTQFDKCETSTDSRKKGTRLESYINLLTISDKNNKPSDNIVLYGDAGCGKSTLVSKLAYEWAKGLGEDGTKSFGTSSPLNDMDLVLYLDVHKLKADQTLSFAVVEQLFAAGDPEKEAKALHKVIVHLEKKCLILLDGYGDTPVGQERRGESLALASPLLPHVFVIVTARPHMKDEFCKTKWGYAIVRIAGFSDKGSKTYVDQYFGSESDIAKELQGKIEKNPVLKFLSSFPVLLVMICNLWKTDIKGEHGTFNSMTKLYKHAVEYINRPHEGTGDAKKECKDKLKDTLPKLGKIALEELFNNSTQMRPKEEIDEVTFKDSKNLGLVKRVGGGAVGESVEFIHKTFQEYCAAKYLMALPDREFHHWLRKITSKNVQTMEYLLRFCCGLQPKATVDIVKHVVNLPMSDASESQHNSWSLPISLLYEAELSDPDYRSDYALHRELEKLKESLEKLDLTDLELAMIEHFTSSQTAKETWLGKIKKLTTKSKLQNAEKLKTLLQGMLSLEEIAFPGFQKQQTGNREQQLAESISSGKTVTSPMLKQFRITALLHHEIKEGLCLSTMMDILSFIPSVTSISLVNVELTEDQEQTMSRVQQELEELEMAKCKVKADTWITLLQNMQSVATINLVHCELEGKCTRIIDKAIKVQSLNLEKCKMNVTTWTKLYDGLTSPQVRVTAVELRNEELSGSVLASYGSQSTFRLESPTGDTSKIQAETVMRLVNQMSSETKIVFRGIELTGSIEESQSHQSHAELVELHMDNSFNSIGTWVKLLVCLPSVSVVKLDHFTLPVETILSLVGSMNQGTGMNSVTKVVLQDGELNEPTNKDLDDPKNEKKDNLQPCESVEKVIVKGCKLSRNSCMKLLDYMPKVKKAAFQYANFEEGKSQKLMECKSLKHLEMTQCNLSASNFAKMLQCLPAITEVHLDCTDLAGDIDISTVKQIEGMKHLYMTDCTLASDTWATMSECMKSLEEVELQQIKMYGEMSKLPTPLEHVKKVTYSECSTYAKGVLGSLFSSTNIKTLKWTAHCSTDEVEETAQIFSAVNQGGSSNLEVLQLDHSTLPKEIWGLGASVTSVLETCLPHLRELNLSNAQMKKKHAIHLYILLRASSISASENSDSNTDNSLDLELFDISGNKIGSASSVITDALLLMPKLKVLRLRDCGLVLEEHFDSISEHWQNTLEELDLSLNKEIMPMLLPMKKLKYNQLTCLKLADTGLHATAVNSIPFKHMPKLNHLDIAKNSVGSEGTKILAKRLKKGELQSLQKLHLDDNGISSSGVTELASSFTVSLQLEELDLNGNSNIDHIGVEEVFRNLEHVKGLKLLDISGIELDRSACDKLPLLKECLSVVEKETSPDSDMIMLLTQDKGRLQSIRDVVKEHARKTQPKDQSRFEPICSWLEKNLTTLACIFFVLVLVCLSMCYIL